MFLRKKKTINKLNIAAKASVDRHPTFTAYDQKSINQQGQRISELQTQIRLLADHLGVVIMRHDKFGTYALVDKEALKSKEPNIVHPVDTSESEF